MGYLIALLLVAWAAVTYWPVAIAIAAAVVGWWVWRQRQREAVLALEPELP